MSATKMISGCALALSLSTAGTRAEEPEGPPPVYYVCTFDQVLPGFGFVPVTFSREVYTLLGGDPDDCQTEVPGF